MIAIRIIYTVDTLKEQGPKMALGQCDKFLKKSPNSELLLSVKAYLLIQIGRDDAAMELIKLLCQKGVHDVDVLLQLEKSFVALNDYKAAAELFQQAFDKSPSEELGVCLFLSVLRCEDLQRLSSVQHFPATFAIL